MRGMPWTKALGVRREEYKVRPLGSENPWVAYTIIRIKKFKLIRMDTMDSVKCVFNSHWFSRINV